MDFNFHITMISQDVFFSLNQVATKNQLLNTIYVNQFFLLSSHFEMRRGQASHLFSQYDNKKLRLTFGVW